jgi:hypothetical protein
MIRFIFVSIYLTSFLLAQTSFSGLNTWTHGQTVGLAGGGYLFSTQNEFRNPAMLPESGRYLKINLVKYPADISAHSIMTNGNKNGHRYGFKLSRLNYGLFKGRDVDNHVTEDYSAGDIHLQAVYAKPSNSGRFVIGTSGGFFISQIEKVKANVFTFSPGVIFYSRLGEIGLSFQNYGFVFDSYTDTEDKIPSFIVTSFARKVPNLPLVLEADYSYFMVSNNSTFTFSGLLNFKNGLIMKGGVSTKKSDQITDVSFLRNLFADMGIGISYEFEDILFAIDTYTYGPGGFVIAVGITVLY